ISIALLPLSFALTAPVAAAVGARATLVGAALIGGAVTLAALFLPGMRDIESSGETAEPPNAMAPLAPAPPARWARPVWKPGSLRPRVSRRMREERNAPRSNLRDRARPGPRRPVPRARRSRGGASFRRRAGDDAARRRRDPARRRHLPGEPLVRRAAR